MTGWQAFTWFMLPVVIGLMAIGNEMHRKEHGVNAPSRKARARIRRNARRKGISESAAYDTWLLHKKRQAGLGKQIPSRGGNASSVVAPRFVRREELDDVLAAEREAEAAAIRAITRPAILPTYDELRAMGRSDLRARREAAGIGVSELAFAIGVSGIVLMQFENGTRTVNPEMQNKIDAALTNKRS